MTSHRYSIRANQHEVTDTTTIIWIDCMYSRSPSRGRQNMITIDALLRNHLMACPRLLRFRLCTLIRVIFKAQMNFVGWNLEQPIAIVAIILTRNPSCFAGSLTRDIIRDAQMHRGVASCAERITEQKLFSSQLVRTFIRSCKQITACLRE